MKAAMGAGDRNGQAATAARLVDTRIGRFAAVFGLFTIVNAALLYGIYFEYAGAQPAGRAIIATTLWVVFLALSVLSGIAAWLLVLVHESRRAAAVQAESHTDSLMAEIAAHDRTGTALKAAKEAAEAANLAKSRYLIGVSHEIRSPLNAIYGYAQLLERANGAGNAIDPVEAARVIRRSSEHLTNVVDGLLDISRIESGVLKLNRDIVPLPEFLESIAEMFRVQALAKGLGFDYQPPANLPAHVRIDEKRLRQILINLLSNAIKYTPAGTAALKVRYRGMIAEFEVSDTGIGIEPADLERIFEPFDRGSSEIAHAEPGTGLGLAITRVLAQVMGGDIAVSSTPGQGSVFLLRLMLAEPGELPAVTARKREVSGYGGPRRTILIVDDDPAQLAVLQGLLRPLGFSVYAASSGAEGIDLARRCQPDLVLLDIQMRGMTGWEVAARLRAADEARPSRNRLKILLVSANAHEFASGNDGAAAHDGFVLKPVELEVLLDAIAAQLRIDWTSVVPGMTAGVVAEVVAGEVAGAVPGVDPALAAVPVSLPDLGDAAASLAALRHLGRVGHVRGIETGLDALAADFPASQPLVEQLRQHLRAFDLKSFLKLLDAHG